MNSRIQLSLTPTPAEAARLNALQSAFAEACNALAPVARDHRCWNRVALHHLAYRQMRERFPGLGSQMVCNAIYSVSRSARFVYQHPQSPFNLARWGARPLPLMRFLPTAPVYFDRHTLSLRGGGLSMFTLDGRMRFRLDLSPADQERFRSERLREIVLARQGERFLLTFTFAPAGDEASAGRGSVPDEWPEYVIVHEDGSAAAVLAAGTAAAMLPAGAAAVPSADVPEARAVRDARPDAQPAAQPDAAPAAAQP